jgi:N-acetylglucosamine kinase-like BadF-type ATPase
MNVFVYGSNLAGINGKGAALEARKNWGAIQFNGEGIQGVGIEGSSYAIPTKDRNIKTLPLDKIKVYVDRFIEYTKNHPEDTFILTAVGTGLAGYKHSDMAPMFRGASDNVKFPTEWISYQQIEE